ncbi:MAG TPA: hypothetical protein VMB03_19435, partial [Bryobacteraceae bacterium]|nr:hypothetical protein [Bryobacteraceae bacterium]
MRTLACLPSWAENPYRLVSLWEVIMQSFEVHELLAIVRLVGNTATLCFESARDPRYRPAQVNNFGKSLRKCQGICKRLNLPMSELHSSQLAKQVEDFVGQLDNDATERMAAMLGVTVENELSLRMFFAISPEKARFYGDNAEPFGSDVANAFPSTLFDASEANRCFALGRNTACVFHLMRVLETGLGVLGKQFGVQCDHTNWETIINRIEKAIGDIDKDPNRPVNWKDEREFW